MTYQYIPSVLMGPSCVLINIADIVKHDASDATITWTLPSPQLGPLQTADGSIRTTIQRVINGSSEVHLTWNFTLSGENLSEVAWEIDNIRIGRKSSSGVSISPISNFREHFDISRSDPATLIIFKVTEADEALFECQVNTDVRLWKDIIQVKIVVPAKLTKVSDDQIVQEGKNMTLFCEASGNPEPNITWAKVLEDDSNSEVLHSRSTWDFTDINRTASGTYRCTADNRIGNPASHEIKVNVTYPAKILEVTARKNEVAVQQSVSLLCKAEGNPPPSYMWTPCEQPQSECHNSVLNISEVLNGGVFICTVTNPLDSDAGNVSVFIAGNVINVTLVITNEKCIDGKYNQSLLWKNLNKTMDDLFANISGYKGAQLKRVSCGSVIVELELKFNSTIRERDVIDELRNAAKGGLFGPFQVNASSITGTRPVTQKTTTATPTTPTDSSDSKKTWAIVGAVVGTVAGISVVAVVVACVVRKKRKCKKKDSKEVHSSESQEQGSENVQGGNGEVNPGYVTVESNRNPRVANPPSVTYDTVENSRKGQREVVKENPTVSYAVVDKSKQKKKEKKPKPGELQYAELAEFNPRSQGMPRSSASYGQGNPTETQYADVNAM
ncbi:hypothetical protein ACROYT_G028365 [Oculina patagonica]